jgi:hypothetical protein
MQKSIEYCKFHNQEKQFSRPHGTMLDQEKRRKICLFFLLSIKWHSPNSMVFLDHKQIKVASSQIPFKSNSLGILSDTIYKYFYWGWDS